MPTGVSLPNQLVLPVPLKNEIPIQLFQILLNNPSISSNNTYHVNWNPRLKAAKPLYQGSKMVKKEETSLIQCNNSMCRGKMLLEDSILGIHPDPYMSTITNIPSKVSLND